MVGVSPSGKTMSLPISVRMSEARRGSDFNLFNSICVVWYFRKIKMPTIKNTEETAIKILSGVTIFFNINGILIEKRGFVNCDRIER